MTAPLPSITAETVITRNPALLVAPVNDEIMMMDIAQGHYYGLDSVGKDVWSALEHPRRFADIVTAMVAEYDADEAQIAADLVVLIEEMAANRVVTLG